MKDHEIADLVNRLTKVANEFGKTQQARERIAHEIRPLSQRTWVGLTDDDLRQIILVAIGVAEAKLKEKNCL